MGGRPGAAAAGIQHRQAAGGAGEAARAERACTPSARGNQRPSGHFFAPCPHLVEIEQATFARRSQVLEVRRGRVR